MKPVEGTYANNALIQGVSGLNIDGCRITAGGDALERPAGVTALGQGSGWNSCNTKEMVTGDSSKGRWPTNTILSHHPDCVCVGTKTIKNKSGGVNEEYELRATTDVYGNMKHTSFVKHGDSDGKEQVENWECHADCPIKILDEQSGTLRARGNITETKEGKTAWFGSGKGHAGERIDKGDAGGASRFFYHAKVSNKERTHAGRVSNRHPTLKPVDLMRYLCRLTATPTGGIVLDPFMGSGSTGIAAVLENRRFIGIEKEEKSFKVAVARLKDVESYKEDYAQVQPSPNTATSNSPKETTKPLYAPLFAKSDE
ncbi:MAG: hypothetical protein DRJ03_24045 [Chloroflexi bacterium]|nr:MAG: hypothetical protein DRJ03_24045 [Chloroflexota bacterium]